MIKNILITGADGQDGKIILNKLHNQKINLFLIAKNFENKFIKKNVRYFKFNLNKKKTLENFFKKNRIDIILHLASNNPNFRQNNYKKHYLENINNSKNLINFSTKYNKKIKFISCSSSRIFRKKNGYVTEKSKVLADDFYSKFRIEINNYLIKARKEKENFDFINVILFNHDSFLRNKKFLLPRLINALITKNKKFIDDIIKENIAADFSHADDICNALVKIIFTNKEIKNIILSSGKKTNVNDIIKYLIQKNKIYLKLKFDKKKESNCIIGNNQYAKKIINWKIRKNIFIAAQQIFDRYKKTN